MALNINRYSKWLGVNLTYFPLGLLTGLAVFLIRSAFSDHWSVRYLAFSLIFGVSINLSITNALFLAVKRFIYWDNASWTTLVKYFLICSMGMIIGVEIAYFILLLCYRVPYHFPHAEDYLFNLAVTFGICCLVYAYNYREAKAEHSLKAKEMDILRLQQLNTQVELHALQAKINPHFLYNALNSIAGLIKEDPSQAENMILKLSKFFRFSMNHSQENIISIREELDILNTYLDLERIRFGDRIVFHIAVNSSLMDLYIPRFLLQPLVENALKHGLSKKGKDGKLSISIEQQDTMLRICVEDNGIPFPEEWSPGYGIQSTYDKLELLYKGRASIQLIHEPTKQLIFLIPIDNDQSNIS